MIKNLIKLFIIIIYSNGIIYSQMDSSRLNFIELFDKQNPNIIIRFTINTGSVNDIINKEGINALTCLMISSGSTSKTPAKKFWEKINLLNAKIESFYDKEFTIYNGEVPKENFNEFYKYFSEMIISPGFDPAEFKRNKEILANYIIDSIRKNNDAKLSFNALEWFIYKYHFYQNLPEGTIFGLNNIIISDIINYYNNYYTQGNITVSISGNYSKEIIQKIKEDFAYVFSYIPKKDPLYEPGKIDGHELLLIEKDTEYSTLSLGFPFTSSPFETDYYSLLLASMKFGGNEISDGILSEKICRKRGLGKICRSFIGNKTIFNDNPVFSSLPRNQTFFNINIEGIPDRNKSFVLKEILYELRKFKENGFKKNDFEKEKKNLLSYLKKRLKSQNKKLDLILNSRYFKSDLSMDKIEKNINKLKLNHVNEFIKKILDDNNLKIVMVAKNCDEFSEELVKDKQNKPEYDHAVSKEIIEEDGLILKYKLNLKPDKIKITTPGSLFETSIW